MKDAKNAAIPTSATRDELEAELKQLRLRNQRCNCPNCPSQHQFITDTTYHVLFNRKGEAVEQCEIHAPSFRDCEETFRELHPDADYWEIGLP